MILEIIGLVLVLLQLYYILKYYEKSLIFLFILSIPLIIIFFSNIRLIKVLILLIVSIWMGKLQKQRNNKELVLEEEIEYFEENQDNKYLTENIENNHTEEISNLNKIEEPIETHSENIEKIDINLATENELTKLPNINIIKAKKIIQLRENGFYIESFDNLQKILNINEIQLEQIKKYSEINKVENEFEGRHVDL